MMGLYPSSHMNDLNEWQKGNAIPPVDADFSVWQDTLGAYALPYGLNTFPIFQNGRKTDYLLSISEYSCPLFKSLWEPKSDEIEA